MVAVAVFVFRRDLRTIDNMALQSLNSLGLPIIPIFLFDRSQADPRISEYFSKRAFGFMLKSLTELQHACPLRYPETLDDLLRFYDVQAIGFNEDYTPFARVRDAALRQWCSVHNVQNVQTSDRDYTLYPIGSIKTKQGTPFSVFTPFYKASQKLPDPPKPTERKIKWLTDRMLPSEFPEWVPRVTYKAGGRVEGLKRLQKSLKNYGKDRDYPFKNGTSRLSPYLKFGCISIREAYHAHRHNEPWVRQLLWKEFYANVAWSRPDVLAKQIARGPNANFLKGLPNIPWVSDHEAFKRWRQGRTGFPIVDAGMRQMNATGYMHNRCRMIVSSFLVKDLLIDWRRGEWYFARRLTDYDPCSNNGGWQWSASTGADPQPYFRIFNPWRQSVRFDRDCAYIKRWIPELRSVPNDAIHAWHAHHAEYRDVGYPAPMLDHAAQALKTKNLLSNVWKRRQRQP